MRLKFTRRRKKATFFSNSDQHAQIQDLRIKHEFFGEILE